jgi:hypothetical protein
MSGNPGTSQSDRQRAYSAGASIARAQMEAEAPLDAAALRAVEASDIIVVRGTYDHVELVLGALAMPFTPVDPDKLPQLRLRPEQLLVVNCPGHVPPRGIDQIRAFVEAGGSLFTTDWALRHVIEPAFPGVLAYNERPTGDDVVRIVVRDHDNPMLKGVMDSHDDPQWWLEGSSYPIKILDPTRVEVLIESNELGTKYGETPVVVLFRHGAGEILHMISHFYLQRTELREARHRTAAASYVQEKGVPLSPQAAEAMSGLTTGDVESAATSARWFANVVAAKKRRSTGSSPDKA